MKYLPHILATVLSLGLILWLLTMQCNRQPYADLTEEQLRKASSEIRPKLPASKNSGDEPVQIPLDGPFSGDKPERLPLNPGSGRP